MKIRLLIQMLFPLIGLLSCAEDHPAPQVLKTSEKNLNFSGKGGAWLLTINSNADWQISGTTEWCTINKTEGYNTDQIIITVDENATQQARSTVLQLMSERRQTEVNVHQDTISGEYHYKLPVIFHILYSEQSDTIQNVKTKIITKMIENCNALYRNNINSVDMNLELVPATHDPDGKELPVAGINRQKRTLSAIQDSEKFLKATNTTDAELLWDPNKYINVFVFTFTQSNELGRSNLPTTPRQNSLIGLEANNTYYTQLPNHPWGITLNNTYLYEEDAYKTLAHELGHYLGLYHVFAETDCATETDYCDDTYSYNQTEYLKWLSENIESLTPQQKYQRTSCDGIKFTSHNTMDYDYSYMDNFTRDQYYRIRHVLEHSPLIPGPKSVIVTKMQTETVPPVVRTIK